MKKYYHVSGLLHNNDVLKRESKNNLSFCEFISECNVSTFDAYLQSYKSIAFMNSLNNSGKDDSKWMTEALFEHVRKTSFKDKPSRIWGVFLSSSLEEAIEFKRTARPSRNDYRAYIYSVTFLNNLPVVEFNMDIYTDADCRIRKNPYDKESYNYALDQAQIYWQGYSGIGTCECLTESDIRVTRMPESFYNYY